MTDLQLFLTTYMNWLEEGAPDKQPFYRNMGLCGNAKIFDQITNSTNSNYELEITLTKEFGFVIRTYPFGAMNYDERAVNDTQHLDEARIKWVKNHLP